MEVIKGLDIKSKMIKNNRKSELWNIKNKNKALKSEKFIGLEEIRNMGCSKSVFKTTLDVQERYIEKE